MNLKDKCKTVTRDELSVMYYGGVSLVYTIYEEQPSEIENLVVMGEAGGGPNVDLLIKTPIDYSDSQFDYHSPFSFESQSDFERFLKIPYDPLNRGFYPLQDRLDREQLIDCSMHIGVYFRVFFDKRMINQCSNHETFTPDLSSDIYRVFVRHIVRNGNDEKFLKFDKTMIFHFNEKSYRASSHEDDTIFHFNEMSIRASLYEDEFGQLLVFEPCDLGTIGSVTAGLYIDEQSEDVIVSINGKVFDRLKYEDEAKAYHSSYDDIIIDAETFINEWSTLVNKVMNTPAGESYSEVVSKKINQSKLMRSTEIPDNFKIIETRHLKTEMLGGLSSLDYSEYIEGDCNEQCNSEVGR